MLSNVNLLFVFNEKCFLKINVAPLTAIIWALMRENLSSGVCEQQRLRPAFASAQSDQHLCYSLIGDLPEA